jgi:hypothetical protein
MSKTLQHAPQVPQLRPETGPAGRRVGIAQPRDIRSAWHRRIGWQASSDEPEKVLQTAYGI